MGPYQPTLIIHGGAGNITRSSLPPDLYAKYHASLLKYLTSTRDLLHNGADAVEAACHAVSMLEDDPLFNCGRGSVFTIDGEIEMEASLMISSVDDFSISDTPSDRPDRSNHTKGKKLAGRLKKNAAVSMIKQTRHPILLAREVLVMADEDEAGRPSTLAVSELDAPDGQYCGDGLKEHSETRSNMHGHLSGPWIEEWGFRRGLERKGREWFWTKKRWEEHRRGLHLDATDQAWHEKLDQHQKESTEENEDDDCYPDLPDEDQNIPAGVHEVPSQGTVGAVCMDSWGNICVATSTGGLTNKRTGRIGDTPTVGAGFWAESWSEELASSACTPTPSVTSSIAISVRHAIRQGADFWIGDCFPGRLSQSPHLGALKRASPRDEEICAEQPRRFDLTMTTANPRSMRLASTQQRAVALSGTGNGDSFLRINAARTAAAIARFSTKSLSQELNISLQDSVTAIAGPGGELQKSADSRWGKTGEGEGGIIAIEATKRSTGTSLGQFTANVVFDFNCAGMWRAYYEDQPNGELEPRVMVFKTEYAA